MKYLTKGAIIAILFVIQAGVGFAFINPVASGIELYLQRNYIPVYLTNASYKAVSIELNQDVVATLASTAVAALQRADNGFAGFASIDLTQAELRILFDGNKRGVVRLRNDNSPYTLVDEVEGAHGRFYQVLLKVTPTMIDVPEGKVKAIKIGIDQVIMVR